jgi:hypothetical protein
MLLMMIFVVIRKFSRIALRPAERESLALSPPYPSHTSTDERQPPRRRTTRYPIDAHSTEILARSRTISSWRVTDCLSPPPDIRAFAPRPDVQARMLTIGPEYLPILTTSRTASPSVQVAEGIRPSATNRRP